MCSFSKDRPHYATRADLVQFESLNTPLWIFDVDRHAVWWANPRAIAFWRARSLEDLLARDYSSDSETVRTRLRQLVEGPVGEGRIQETWTLYPDQTPTTVLCDMQPVWVEGGRHAILIEVSQSLDFQDDPEALRILEAARSSALLVSSFTMSGHLLTQNPASHACYANLPHDRNRTELENRIVDVGGSTSILTAVEKSGHFETELSVRTVNGIRVHRITARKGRDPVTGDFVTILNEEDMTDQARLRQRLEDLNAELESRVAQRTKSLQTLNENLAREIKERQVAEEKLRHAQKLEAIGQLTGGVAHDFNNLLAVIAGSVEVLADEVGNQSEALDFIMRATERGAELTQRLLAFSRKQPLRPQSFNLGALATGMSDLLARALGETVEIETVVAEGLWDVRADPSQVENALLNLALNGRDAMPNGGKLIIECRNTSLKEDDVGHDPEVNAGDYVALVVTDNGTGMSSKVINQAFEPFFTTKDVGEGSGLGLSMVYGFAKQSGGHASIYSEEGYGSTVTLYLPRAERSEETANAESTVTSKRRSDLPRGNGESILVIEDSADVRDLCVRMLETLNYKPIAVGDAKAAATALARRPDIALILSDVVLPDGMSGPEFAAQVRKKDAGAKFLFMSGYPAEASQHNGLIDPNESLLNKPFRRQTLAETLHKTLRNR